MNINELFFFKTFPCKRISCLNHNTCYFYHKEEKDRRRFLIDFLDFFYKENSFKEEPKNTFSIQKKDLMFYSNLSNLLINPLTDTTNFNKSFCSNQIEKNFHILNYRENHCIFEREEFEFECPNKIFCYSLHKSEKKSKNIIFAKNKSNDCNLCKFF